MAYARQAFAREATASRFNAYIQNIARALIRDHGMDESQAIATAVNAVKRWARGNLGEAHGHVHPEVRHAAQRALSEWEKLKESHSGPGSPPHGDGKGA